MNESIIEHVVKSSDFCASILQSWRRILYPLCLRVSLCPLRLLQLCQRTMSLPVGRGLFTLFSYQPVPTEPLPVPKLNLTGEEPNRNEDECIWLLYADDIENMKHHCL